MGTILGSSKGQMFIIAAIFMIIGFVLLRGLLAFPEIAQEKTFQDISILDRNLKNVRSEYEYAISLSTRQENVNSTGSEYLFNFTRLVRDNIDSSILYVFIVSNGTTNNFSATIGNFLKTNVSGTINFTGSTPAGAAFTLNDKEDIILHFEGSPVWITATLNYTTETEIFDFDGTSDNYAAGFFDVSMRDGSFFIRSKSTHNRSWVD